jgi:putative sigma-54 modulation protein
MQIPEVKQMQVMEINLTALNFQLSLDQHEYVERRLTYALESNASLIGAVEVWLSELNDPNAQRNQRCLVQVTLKGGALIVVDTTEADLYVAIHRAADRAGWKVARCLSRRNLRGKEQQAAGQTRAPSGLRVSHQLTSNVMPM